MTIQTDVAIIGGGATGAGIARDLALRGVDVSLFERGGLGGGTSGRSHGLLHSGGRYAESDPIGAEECIRESRILRDIAEGCIRETGGLFVQLESDDPAYFEEKLEACNELDIPTETISAEEAHERVPGLTEDVERAFTVPDGVIYPSRLVVANAADAREHGASIHTHTPVESVTTANGEITELHVGGEINDTVEATQIVNATGAWAEVMGEDLGVDVSMQPTRGVMISVEYDGLDPVLNRCRDPDDGDIIVPHDGEVVLGTTSVAVEDPDDYEEADWEVERSVDECAELIPDITDAPEVRTWWGVRPLYEPDEDERDDGRGISRGFFVINHAERNEPANLISVVGGKLTTYRQMAEAASDQICAKLGVDASCKTDEQSLYASDDPAQLDALIDEFDAVNPTDRDIVTTATPAESAAD